MSIGYRIILFIILWIDSGFTWINSTLDNSNTGFNLPVIILFPIINRIAESETKSNQYTNILGFCFWLLLWCFLIDTLMIFFICYECLIVFLFILLFIFIPSFHRIRTSFFSFLFSVLGSINFILSLFYIVSSISLFALLLIVPFLIKIPTFPFHYRSPEVHCDSILILALLLIILLW